MYSHNNSGWCKTRWICMKGAATHCCVTLLWQQHGTLALDLQDWTPGLLTWQTNESYMIKHYKTFSNNSVMLTFWKWLFWLSGVIIVQGHKAFCFGVFRNREILKTAEVRALERAVGWTPEGNPEQRSIHCSHYVNQNLKYTEKDCQKKPLSFSYWWVEV